MRSVIPPRGRSIVCVHADAAHAAARKIDLRPINRLIGRGVDCDLRAFDRSDVALPLDRVVGNARIWRIMVIHLIDDNDRGDLRFDGVS